MQLIKVLIVFTEEGPSKTVAHNLNHDLVCVAENFEKAQEKILAATEDYIRWSVEDSSLVLDRPAPMKYWSPFLEHLRKPEPAFPVRVLDAMAQVYSNEPDFSLRSFAVA